MATHSTEYLTLDWRDGVPRTELLSRIQKLLTELDMNGKSKIETADTRNHRALSVEDRDGVPTMCRTPCRAFRTVANHEPFWARFVAVGLEIIDMVSFCEPRKNRKLGYKHKGTGIPKRMVRKLIFDWAITIGVHPWALGFTAQEGGLVKLPRYVVITCTLRPNVFLDETEKRTLQGPESIIPSRIITLTVSSKPKIRAVVISEHRSLDFELAAVCRHFEDIIFVLTGGYPSIAVREFVHLVSINLALANVPFYYFNDHDIYGFQQFKGWKYGFGATAWASPSLICSQLEWGGPSVAAVEATIKPYSQEVMASRQAADPQLTSQVAETQRVQWELKTLNRFRRKMQQAGASEEARRRVVSMKRTGLIGTEEEGVVDEEIEKMMSSHQEFHMMELSNIRPSGAELFIAERLEQLAPRAVPLPIMNVAAQVSQRTKQFNKHMARNSSQVLSQSSNQPAQISSNTITPSSSSQISVARVNAARKLVTNTDEL